MITRTLSEDGRFLITKSDRGLKIRKMNSERDELYSEAWDLADTKYEYEETDEPIEVEAMEMEVQDETL